MAHDDTEAPTGAPARGAQTVAPVQASALQFAASILGEASYTPEAQLNASLSAPARVSEPAAQPTAPVEQPVVEPVVPVAEPVVPVPVAEQPVVEPVVPVAEPVEQPVVEQPRGWFGRLIAKLLGRG
ncbi:hypothetical protein [Kineococcus arenarius]|uniref:hypothetical protein n=1 Tax=Kineococcus sp. SYSU DK007 TaxID=3383128 RepID=UPI003D7CB21C